MRTYNDFLSTINPHPKNEELCKLAASLREEDIREIEASITDFSRAKLVDYLTAACNTSDLCVLIYEPSTRIPMAIYGAISFSEQPGVAYLWMHGTYSMRRVSTIFLRLGHYALEDLRTHYSLLTCSADERNILHTRWLSWLGFTPLARHVYNDPALPFLTFALPGRCEPIKKRKKTLCAQ